MAMPTLSVPAFPNVPNVAGVPALIRKAGPALDAIGYISNINNKLNLLFNTPTEETWGVFDANGDEAISPDTFLGIDYKNGSRLLDYPLEQGAFETYNKVQNPFDASISMAKGGTVEERQDFLYSVEALIKSLELYTITTPEISYVSVNLEHFDYRREVRNGSHLIIVTLFFREIRVTTNVVGLAADDVETPAGADDESLGQVAPAPLTSTDDAAISGAAKATDAVKSVTSSISDAVASAKTAVSGAIDAFSPAVLATTGVVTSVLTAIGSPITAALSVTPGQAKTALRGVAT